MNKRTVVFRSFGDPEFGKAAIGGMMVVVNPPPEAPPSLTEEQMAVVKAELEATKEKLKHTEAALGVKQPRETREFKNKIKKHDRKFRQKRSSKILDVLLLAYAMAWLLISEFYKRELRIWKGEA